jgi:predicted alpha-1,2-mannosidase
MKNSLWNGGLLHSVSSVGAGLALWVLAAGGAAAVDGLTANVNPLNGTASDGDTFPGAVLPFGMIQWSPDTTPTVAGGYAYSASRIVGFGLDHMSGAGCAYGGNFAFMPYLGALTNSPGTNGSSGRNYFATFFSHTNEVATPGYYSVVFTNGIQTELTVTNRAGFSRFTYPAGSVAGLSINAGSDTGGTVNAAIQINPLTREVSGWTKQSGFCGHTDHPILYFCAVFDHDFASYGVWSGTTLYSGTTNASGAKTGAAFTFSLPNGEPVLARTAVSFVSVDNARLNLDTENPAAAFTSAGFNAMAAAASNTWNGYLGKIEVQGGSMTNTRVFYTMMYHALQAPSVVSDVNGQYMGFDGVVRTASGFTKYEFFSGWDIYRNECQFLAMIDPARAGDMAQSLVQDAKESGTLPRWSVATADSGVMPGVPAVPIIAGMHAFGATNFDRQAALSAMVKGALDPNTVASNGVVERIGERDYLNLGFVPQGVIGRDGPVSLMLEHCSADFALARFALALGDLTNYASGMSRAQNWRNLYNTNSGYLQLRRSTGFWPSGFVNNRDTYDSSYYLYPGYSRRAYVEGTASQYVWMIPYNYNGLFGRMGGWSVAAARLDTFFTQINAGTASAYAYVGNEPCAETPWVYHFLGQPYKASSVVRQILKQLYGLAPAGLPGNDDLGAMSSWYLMAALGMYPQLPGDDVLVLHGPLFPRTVLHLRGGDVVITGDGAGDAAPYVQSFALNGQARNASWIRFADIANGGTLAFTMSATPNTNWGATPSDVPPSYTDGMTSPLAMNYYWGSGFETSEARLAWTNSVDATGYPAGGSNNVGPILSTVSGPELGVRTGTTQTASNSVLYSGMALGGVSNYCYLKMFNLSGSNVVVSPGMHFSYWVFPQSPTNSSLVSGSNSAFVALDLLFSDGSNLRDSGLMDQHGVGIHPAKQAAALALDNWNYVTVDLTPLAGRTVTRIDFGYEQPNASGGYRGFVDDVGFTTPVADWFGTNLATGAAIAADSQQTGHLPAAANDSDSNTCWTAGDSSAGHWLKVDLGAICNLTGDQVVWRTNGLVFGYTVEASFDGASWSTVVDKTASISPLQTQVDWFTATARYVRFKVTALPAGETAAIAEVRLFGSLVSVPSIPTGLKAIRRYNGAVGLSWNSVGGATAYRIARSTIRGAATLYAGAGSNTFADSAVTDGGSYYYRVAAENLAGVSDYSDEAGAQPLVRARGSYAAAVLEATPMAYWPLNETNGTTACDLAGCHDGAYVGGVILGQAGIPNGGFGFPGSYCPVFDGSTGYVDIPSGPFNLTNAISIVAWVKAPTVSHFSGVVGRGDSSWRLTVNASGKPGGDAAHVYSDATGSASIAGTNWHMLAYTYTGSPSATNNGLLYVDGVPVATNTVGAFSGNALDVWIAGSPDYGTARLLAGSVAQVAVFTNTLSGTAIQTLYDVGTNRTPLVGLCLNNTERAVNVAWSGGTLLQSTNLLGPWRSNFTTSPYTSALTNPQMFYRVRAAAN